MIVPPSLRFFLAIRLHAPYALITLLAVFILGIAMLKLNPATGLDDGVGMVLFVQMFLASSGFTDRARRGHFDPLLIFSVDRRATLAAHWVVSSLPGVLAWLGLVLAARAFGNTDSLSAITAGSGAATFIVSAVAWAAGFALSRGTAGFLWTAALFAALLRHVDLTQWAPISLVFCPFLLMKPSFDPASAVAAVLFAFVVLLIVWRTGASADVHLLERA